MKRRNKTQKILKMEKLKKILMLRTIERILNNVHEVLDLNLNDLIYIIRELSDEEKDKARSGQCDAVSGLCGNCADYYGD